MNKTRFLVASLLVALALTACKSGGTTTTFNTVKKSTTTTTIGTTDVTNADGSPVTNPNGSPVTNAAGGTTTTAASTKPVTTLTPATLVKETGTTAVSTKPNTDHLAMPKAGKYTFRDTATDPDKSYDARYKVSISGQTVRIQQTDVITTGSPSYYEETHRSDGLFLTNSNVSGGNCVWSPAAVSLPQSVIDGGTASSDSHCNATAGGQNYSFGLKVNIAFKALRTVSIGGKSYRCIDVIRHRVLSIEDTTETVDAVDTYAFDLGLRIQTSETITRNESGNSSTHKHDAVLTALP